MKTLLYCILALSFMMPVADADPKAPKLEDKYRFLKSVDEKERGVIAQLEKINIENVAIRDLKPSEALNYLRRKIVGDKGGGVINLVIRGSQAAEKKITIQKEGMNYAEAVDAICEQVGWSWKIAFNESSGAPILVLTTKSNGQQGAGGKGGGVDVLDRGIRHRLPDSHKHRSNSDSQPPTKLPGYAKLLVLLVTTAIPPATCGPCVALVYF